MISDFGAEFPQVDLVLRDIPAADIIEQVRAGAVEFGVTILGAGHWHLDSDPLTTEPYHLTVPQSHPLATRGAVTLDDLRGLTMVRIRTQSTNRELVDAALEPVQAKMQYRDEVMNAVAALSIVAAVTVLPRQMGLWGGGQVVGLPLGDVEVSRRLGLVRRRGLPLSQPAQWLVDLLRARLSGAVPVGPVIIPAHRG